jgi:hypothetical protein
MMTEILVDTRLPARTELHNSVWKECDFVTGKF